MYFSWHARLFGLAWLASAMLVCALPAQAAGEPPQARAGVLDLGQWDFKRDGPALLAGEWAFNWQQFDDPSAAGAARASGIGSEQLFARLPAAWHGMQAAGAPLGSDGYASYRLRVNCGNAKDLSLALPPQHSAVRLYVNGRELAHQGSPGATASESHPAFAQQYVPLGELACPLDIVAHVSNFDHRRGGLVRGLELGDSQQLQMRRETGLIRDMVALGGVGLMGVLPILFFLWRRKERAPLYFGLFCLSSSVFIALSGERALLPLLGPLSWDAYLTWTFLGFYGSLVMFARFIHALYPAAFGRLPIRLVSVLGGMGVLLVLTTPARIYTLSIPPLVAGALLLTSYIAYVLVRAARGAGGRGRGSATILLAGFAVLAVAIGHDTIYFRNLLSSYWTPFGLLAFSLAPGIMLARRISRALASEELRTIEQRERTNLLVRATKAGLLDWDAIADVATYSERYKEILGYPIDAVAPQLPGFYELLHPDDRELVRSSFVQELRDRSVRSATRHHKPRSYRMRRAGGDYVWVHAEGIALLGDDGRTLRFICSFIDISDSKRHETEMSDQVKFIADLFDTVPIALALRDPESRYLIVNKTWELYAGVKREDVIGKTLRERSPLGEVELAEALDREVLALGLGATMGPRENTFGGRRYTETRTAMADSQGRPIGVLVASIDIHEKYLTEQALARERERLQLLVRSTKAGFGDWDARRDVVSYTARFKEMLGYPGDADTTDWPSIFEMMHPDDSERSREQFRIMIRRKTKPEGEQEPGAPMSYRLRRADGSYIWIHAEGISQVDAQGRTERFITSYLDVTAFHEQEEALRAQIELTRTEQRRLDLVVRAARVGIVDWDGHTHETYYSPIFREMRGYAADADTAAWPDYFKVMIHPDDRKRVTGRWVPFIKGQGPEGPRGEYYSPDEYRLLRADGSYAWVQVSGIAVRDASGFAVRWIAAIIDISERRAQQEALSASHDQIAAQAAQMADRIKFINDLVDALPLALSMRDLQGRYVFANRTWERYYNQRRDEVIGLTVRDKFSPEEAAAVEALDRAALDRGPDKPLYTADAPFRDRQFTQTRTVMANARQEAVGVVIAAEDVTDRRAIERALQTEQRRIELVVRAAKAGIVDWSGLTRTAYYSPRLREILGHAPDADTTSWPDYFDMIHPDDAARVAGEFRKHVTAKRAAGEMAYHDRIEYRLRRADQSWIWVQGMGVSQSNEKGYTVQFIASITDITESRAQTQALLASRDQIAAQAAQLEGQNEALIENVRLREEVERIARHDIKTPLNSIISVPRLLREERRLTPEADELLGIVERAGYRILSMVNLSLDLYKMEQGSYIFRPDAVDLVDLIDKVAVDIRSHAASKNVNLLLMSSTVPACAWAEELLCYSLIANLLKNAVEASPEGAVVTVTTSFEAGAGDGHVVLRIHNAGVVPAAIRSHFFTKYATAGKASGTGLGTYSARLMARTQDGDVSMQTSVAEGTTLAVSLRAAPAGKVPSTIRHAGGHYAHPPLPLANLPALRVLLVDDDEYNLLIVRRFLPCPPLTVSTAFNGRVALEMTLEQAPDVIFMDLDMPVMGGLEAISLLREQEVARGRARCFAVVLSSHDDEETRLRCLASGFDAYLTKPVTRDLIQQTLLDYASGRQDKRSLPASPAPVAGGLRNVTQKVVIDPEIFELLESFLASRHQLLDEMDAAIAVDDSEGLRQRAHQMAGSLAVYGFQWAADVSRQIERESASPDRLRTGALVQALRAHLQTATIVKGDADMVADQASGPDARA